MSRRLARLFALVIVTCVAGGLARAAPPTPERFEEVRAERAKTVLELQPYRRSQQLVAPGRGGRELRVSLVDLAPSVSAWHLLVLDEPGGGSSRVFHLENPDPSRWRLLLDTAFPEGITLLANDAPERRCPLWAAGVPDPLDLGERSAEVFVALCDGLLYLRRPVRGHRTNLERVAELLRDNVWLGDRIITTTRDLLLQDRDRERAELGRRTGAQPARTDLPANGEPAAAALRAGLKSAVVSRSNLAVTLRAGVRPAPGRWQLSADHPGVWVSLVEPAMIAESILQGPGAGIGALDAVESSSLTYLLAFDLARFELGYELGTDHPRLGWSDRPPPESRNNALPGPDGIDAPHPLVMAGTLSPPDRERVIATFTGSFKRQHGAFKYGAFAARNHGSHYGFVANGVTLSRLHPGLATLIVRTDGRVELETWTDAHDQDLDTVRHARQSGVPLVEPGAAGGDPVPGALVARWGPGNWSGSSNQKLRTMRAGVCMQDSAAGRFLIYAVFTTATPRAMARVFQAYHCRYAMELDINALEHTYAALYGAPGSKPIQHLIDGMGEVDKVTDGQTLRRFVDYPDNRDFFYLTPRR